MTEMYKYFTIMKSIIKRCGLSLSYLDDDLHFVASNKEKSIIILYNEQEFKIQINLTNSDQTNIINYSISTNNLKIDYNNTNNLLTLSDEGSKVIRFNESSNSIKLFISDDSDKSTIETTILITSKGI